jgi:hypothetical protein
MIRKNIFELDYQLKMLTGLVYKMDGWTLLTLTLLSSNERKFSRKGCEKFKFSILYEIIIKLHTWLK